MQKDLVHEMEWELLLSIMSSSWAHRKGKPTWGRVDLALDEC